MKTVELLYVVLLLGFAEAVLKREFFTSETNFANGIEGFLETKQVSISCREFLGEYCDGLKQRRLWALKMFDATGKPPSGVLSGNLAELGSFDECLSMEHTLNSDKSISGVYCLADVRIPLKGILPKPIHFMNPETIQNWRTQIQSSNNTKADHSLTLTFGTCWADACLVSEREELFKYFGIEASIRSNSCQSKATQPKLDGGAIATLVFLGFIGAMVIVSTCYDTTLFYLKKKPIHPVFLAFSILTNGKKLLKVSKSPKQIECLHGIRVISMMWVIIGHRYSAQSILPSVNSFDYYQWLNNKSSMFIINAPLSVDTFFLMSGVVISYIYMGQPKKTFNVLIYYVHRYLRLTPAFAVVILIYVTLLIYVSSGPYWPEIMNGTVDGCKENWWRALLYIQNIDNFPTCINPTWYLCVDTQLFLISPFLIFPLKRYPKIALSVIAGLTGMSILSSFLTAWFYELSASLVGNTGLKAKYYWQYYYFAPWTRAGPWLMGLILGYMVFQFKQKKRLPLNKIVILVLWACSLALLCTCVFAGHGLTTGEYNQFVHSIHTALIRPAWALGLSWVILACATGNGGPIDWFLSLSGFQIISKFTYCMYLVHYAAIYIQLAEMRVPPFMSDRNEMFIFWGDFATSFAAAFILTLTFESPILVIEKFIFRRMEKQSCDESTKKTAIEP